MVYERTGYAPWSLTREAGVQSATVDGTIQVPQYVYPNLDTGFLDEKGNWKGRKSSDEQFIGLTTAEAVGNGAEALFPDTANFPSIDMTGFSDLLIAFKPSRGGNLATTAVMGPDTAPFANLTPVGAAVVLRGASLPQNSTADLQPLFEDAAQDAPVDVWTIYILQGVVAGQKNLQFKVVNNSGGNNTIEFGFMRLV
jgi:hypothetical protein